MSTFSGTITNGIVLSSVSQNPATLAAGGYVTNTTTLHFGDGVYGTTAAAWNFTNRGTIKATATASAGMDLRAGGTVTNAAGALISGVVDGIFIGGRAGTVTNSGTIRGTGASSFGIDLNANGFITNAAGGLISGKLEGVIARNGGTIANSGTIASTGYEGII